MRMFLVILASLVLAVFALCEVVEGYPVPGWLYLPTAILFAVGIVRRAPAPAQIGRLAALAMLLAAIVVLYSVPWSSRKPFLRDLYRIKPGMTEAEVRQIMARYQEGTGWPSNPFAGVSVPRTLHDLGSSTAYSAGVSPSGELTLSNSLVFRHAMSGRFDSDWGIVSFSNGRVATVSFSPD